MPYPARPSERAGIVGQLVPLLRNTITDARTDAVDMSKFNSALVIFMVGATDTTVDCNVKSSPTSAGTYTLISGKSATQLSATDDNKIVLINVLAEELATGEKFIKGEIDTGTGTTGANTAILVLGMDPRFGPASDDDLTEVAQIVE